jgi:hypothetical protein
MSTAATTHHRFSDPIATAAAVVVIIGGATVIGVAASQGDSTSTQAPPSSLHGKAEWNHPLKPGLSGFSHSQQGSGHPGTLKGGQVQLGQP